MHVGLNKNNLFHPYFTIFQRDAALEQKVINWISSVIDERPTTDYEHFIQDGSILSR